LSSVFRASLAAIASAQAADLPIKAKAVEYVRVCSLYGAGFWSIPGTDTCIRIGGYLRVDTTFDGGGAQGQPAWSGDFGQRNRFSDDLVSRSRAYGGTHAPDVVGNVKVDQAWGRFQLSAAAHEVDASYNILGAGAAPLLPRPSALHLGLCRGRTHSAQ
jgi:hypothetical protein